MITIEDYTKSMETVQKSANQLNYRQMPASSPPAILRLNLPPELAQKFVLYGLVMVLVGAALCWLGYTQVRSYYAPPTVKIGLVAPFEGLYRASGYEVLFAVKLALQERNTGQGIRGYRVELVALNDFNEAASAAQQARALVADPDIIGVIGHLTPATTRAALPIYQEANLAVAIPWSVEAAALTQDDGVVSLAATVEETNAQLATFIQGMNVEPSIIDSIVLASVPSGVQAVELATDAVTAGNIVLNLSEISSEKPITVFGQVESGNLQLIQVAGDAANGVIFVSPGPGPAEVADGSHFVDAYQAMTGLLPGPRAALAYDAANVLLDSLEQAIIKGHGNWQFTQPNRVDVSASMMTVQRPGVSGPIAFRSNGLRIEAPIWIYQISKSTYPGTRIYP
ncbi:MAG: ABC transporter substrate-binding protein [Anaerolineae bacterium]|nr:ABC transporter substrate-binding protein [Anaerolineae bacterium]